jgi:hypothetical protein
LLGLLFDLEVKATFNGLHVDVSQKIDPFITPAIRTSNPTIVGCSGYSE